jgi:menaquinone-dependent protoporphyrinogen oxidase
VRVLVIFASSRGGTEGLAHMVAEALARHGIDTEIGPANSVDDIEGYDAVVVGGALYSGKWHPDATWFVERHLETLRTKNVWFFSSGPLDASARSGSLAPVDQVQSLARRTDIRGHMTFGGYLEPKSTGFLGSLLSWGKPGDYRDPHQVEEWVERLVAHLDEPRTITLPDIDPTDERIATRVIRRLVAAGTDEDEATEDLGLDVLMD